MKEEGGLQNGSWKNDDILQRMEVCIHKGGKHFPSVRVDWLIDALDDFVEVPDVARSDIGAVGLLHGDLL